MMKLSAKIADCIQPLTIFAKHFLLGASQGYEYASDKTKNTGVLSFISQKIRTAISANFSHLNSTLFSHYYLVVLLLPCGKTLLITNSVHVSLISN